MQSVAGMRYDRRWMIGKALGPYRVVEKLGSGGMGVVYAAQHSELGHEVAVKVLWNDLSGEREVVQRFYNEAIAAAAIDHPGIVRIFDLGFSEQGRAYIVMERLDGVDLAQYLRERGTLGSDGCVAVGRQVADAMAAAHATGILHRDLKPENVFLIADELAPGGVRVKILDFGIAKLSSGIRRGSLRTEAHAFLGSPYYMSPEQCRGAEQIDARSDVYALGCLLYEMATGHVPFPGERLLEVVEAHRAETPAPPSRRNAELPGELEALILRTLAKDPSERPQSMRAVSETLASIAGASSGLVPPLLQRDAERAGRRGENDPGRSPVAFEPTVRARADGPSAEVALTTTREQVDPIGATTPRTPAAGAPIAARRYLFGVGVILLCLALGFGIGWMARGPRETSDTPVIAAPTTAGNEAGRARSGQGERPRDPPDGMSEVRGPAPPRATAKPGRQPGPRSLKANVTGECRGLPKPSRATAAVRGRAAELYRKQSFRTAANVLRTAATDASDEDAASLRSLASCYEAVGASLTRAEQTRSSNPTGSMAAFRRALSLDETIGDSVHATHIRQRLGGVAPRAAAAYIAQRRYEAAKKAIDFAVDCGAGDDPLVRRVRKALEREAGAFYQSAEKVRGRDPLGAAKLLRRVLRMVPPESPWYGKAAAALGERE